MLIHLSSQLIQICLAIFIFYLIHREMELLLKVIPLIVIIIFRNFVLQLLPHSDCSLISPTPRNIFNCIASSTQHYGRKSISQHIFQTITMTFQTEIKLAQFIMTQTISTKLNNQCMRPILGHDSLHNIFEEIKKCLVRNSRFQRNIQRIVFPFKLSYLINITSSWKKFLAKLMKGYRHHSIRQIKSLFNAITMVYINIEIQNSRVHLQELKDSYDYIIHIAKSACLRFFSMVKSSTPIYGDVCLAIQKQSCRINGSACRYLTDIIQTIESRAISGFADLKLLSFFQEFQFLLLFRWILKSINRPIIHLAGGAYSNGAKFCNNILTDILFQIFDILLVMKTTHLLFAGIASMVNIQFTINASGGYQRMGH